MKDGACYKVKRLYNTILQTQFSHMFSYSFFARFTALENCDTNDAAAVRA